jgi:hypothetical protein
MRISMKALLWLSSLGFIAVVFLFCCQAAAQTSGSSGTIQGVVMDPSKAVVAGAKVEIHNPVSGYDRTVTSDGAGRFSIDFLTRRSSPRFTTRETSKTYLTAWTFSSRRPTLST